MTPFANINNEVVLSTAYLAPVSYYKILSDSNTVLMEHCENYVKQTYRNRCIINTSNGIMSLNIPVQSNGGKKIIIKDVKISEHDNWQTHHWRSIKTAYNSSPFFEYYEDDFIAFYEKKWKFLWDYNWDFMQKILILLDVEPKIKLTTSYQLAAENDYRGMIHPKKKHITSEYEYYQVFRHNNKFSADLSIIDLLFNMGNESILVMNKMRFNN